MNPHLKTLLTSRHALLFYTVTGFLIACYVISDCSGTLDSQPPVSSSH